MVKSGSGSKPSLTRWAFFSLFRRCCNARTVCASINREPHAAILIMIIKIGMGTGGGGLPTSSPAGTNSVPIKLPPRSIIELCAAPMLTDWPSGCT